MSESTTDSSSTDTYIAGEYSSASDEPKNYDKDGYPLYERFVGTADDASWGNIPKAWMLDYVFEQS